MVKEPVMNFLDQKRNKKIFELACWLLTVLWIYAATSKLLDFETFKGEMLNQVFPKLMAEALVRIIPATELIVTALLINPRTQRRGLYGSLFLLTLFSIYIAIVMTGVMGRIPCSCGGILEKMSWGQHLIFNLSFIALTLTALLLGRHQWPIYKRGNMNFPHWKGGAMGKES